MWNSPLLKLHWRVCTQNRCRVKREGSKFLFFVSMKLINQLLMNVQRHLCNAFALNIFIKYLGVEVSQTTHAACDMLVSPSSCTFITSHMFVSLRMHFATAGTLFANFCITAAPPGQKILNLLMAGVIWKYTRWLSYFPLCQTDNIAKAWFCWFFVWYCASHTIVLESTYLHDNPHDHWDLFWFNPTCDSALNVYKSESGLDILYLFLLHNVWYRFFIVLNYLLC